MSIKKNNPIGLILILSFLILSFCSLNKTQAQTNPDLIKDLNEVFVYEIKSMQQCEAHSDAVNISIPYINIIEEKVRIIRELADLITDLGGTISEERLDLEKSKQTFQALNLDAQDQIVILGMYDQLLDTYGQPAVRLLINKARRQAIKQYMFLSNTAQKIIFEDKLIDELAK